MNFATDEEFSTAIGKAKEKWSAGLFAQTLAINNIDYTVAWVHKDEIQTKCPQIVLDRGWEPDTSLVVYGEPPDKSPETTNPPPIQDPNEDQMMNQLSKLNTTQCTCLFFKDMTLDKLIGLINQVVKMRAFL